MTSRLSVNAWDKSLSHMALMIPFKSADQIDLLGWPKFKWRSVLTGDLELADWERWDRFVWNRRLIDFYFARDDGLADPVRRLDTSWAVLARLTGDSAAEPEHVRDQFIERLRKSLGEHTLGAFLSTKVRKYQGVPTSFIFLFATCLAASEAQEDRDNEGSVERNFRDALCTMLDSDRHAVGLDRLADAWEYFAEWTAAAEASGAYRRLVLPDVGNETQIGYSKRLVFPSLRDQMRLLPLLDRVGLLMEDPPVDMLISHLRPLRNEMSGELRATFDELLVHMTTTAEESSDPRFLIAVNAVARNAELLAGNARAGGSLTVLLLDYSDSFELVAAASSPEPFDRAVTTLDDFLPVEWPYRVLAADAADNTITWLFDGDLKSSLSWVLRPGIVPFTAGEHGVPELLKRGRLQDAGYLLVRTDRLKAVLSVFGIPEVRVRPSPLDGWFVVKDPDLRQLTAEQLRTAGLNDVPALHPRPFRNYLRFRDGYPVLGDFLGYRSAVPWISAPGAVSVTASLDGSELVLQGVQGRWYLPDRDLFGLLRVRAQYSEGNPIEKSAALISEPTDLEYKVPSNENDWMQETLAGTSIYSLARSANKAEVEQEIPGGTHSIYLSPVVGEFLASGEGAIYELASFGEMRWVRLLHAELAPPTSRVADKGLCRKWRKVLDEFLPYADNELVRQAIRSAKAATANLKTLNVVASDRGHRPQMTGAPPVHDGCLLVQAAVGTVCARRSGMAIRDWNRLLEEAFSISYEQRRFVHRAWLEAGLIDELRQTQWQSAAIFARKPALMTFKVGDTRFGSIDGLVMPSRLAQLNGFAIELGLSTSLNPSPSPYLPARLMVRSAEAEKIDEFAVAASLEIDFLSRDSNSPVRRRDIESREVRTGYVPRKAYPTFPVPDGVMLRMHQRPGSPSFWSAGVADHTIWSYSPEAVSFWIRMALGEEVARLGSGSELEIVGSFLPLSAARWLALVSGTNPGPGPKNSYVNPAPSRILAEKVLQALKSESSAQLTSGDIK